MPGAEDFVGVPGYQHHLTAQTVDQLAMMAAAAVTARFTVNTGGKVLSYVHDKVKNLWMPETGRGRFTELVETYNLSSSISLQATPIQSPEKDCQTEEEVVPQKWVAAEIDRLNGMIDELQQLNQQQGRMITAYHRERLTTTLLNAQSH